MEKTFPANLTPGERDCIFHRLDAPDAIADVFGCEVLEGHSPEDVMDACRSVRAFIVGNGRTVSDLTACERDVLVESIEGSTWLGSALCEDARTVNNAAAQMQRAGRKIAQALDRRILIPTC